MSRNTEEVYKLTETTYKVGVQTTGETVTATVAQLSSDCLPEEHATGVFN